LPRLERDLGFLYEAVWEPIAQIDLADALGLTSVHVNRVPKDMRGQARITLRCRTLVLEAWDELLRVSEFDPTYLHLRNERLDELAPTARARRYG